MRNLLYSLAGFSVLWASVTIATPTMAPIIGALSRKAVWGLGAYYPLQSNLNDSSGNGIHLAGTTGGYVPAYFGNGVSLDGSQSVTTTSGFTSSTFSAQEFTVTAWINTETGDGTIVANSTQYSFYLSGGYLNLFWAQCAGGTCGHPSTSSTAVSSSTWTHIAVVFGSREPYFYINGIRSGSIGPILYSPPTSGTVTIGSGFKGIIQDLRFYQFALNADQIKTIYNR